MEHNNNYDVNRLEGSLAVVTGRCIGEIGYLDPYLYPGWEDTDCCRRAGGRDRRVGLVPHALAHHYAGSWSGGSPQNMDMAVWLQTRNYYIDQLADPFGRFSANLWAALHLLFVHIRRFLPGRTGLLFFDRRVFIGS